MCVCVLSLFHAPLDEMPLHILRSQKTAATTTTTTSTIRIQNDNDNGNTTTTATTTTCTNKQTTPTHTQTHTKINAVGCRNEDKLLISAIACVTLCDCVPQHVVVAPL